MITIDLLSSCKYTYAELSCVMNDAEVYIGESNKLDLYMVKHSFYAWKKNNTPAKLAEFKLHHETVSMKFMGMMGALSIDFDDAVNVWKNILSSFIKSESIVNGLMNSMNEEFKVSFDMAMIINPIRKKSNIKLSDGSKKEVYYNKLIHASSNVYKSCKERNERERQELAKYVYKFFKDVGYIDQDNRRTMSGKDIYAACKSSEDALGELNIPVCSISYKLVLEVFKTFNVGKMAKLGRPRKSVVEKVEEVIPVAKEEDEVQDDPVTLEDVVYFILPENDYAWKCFNEESFMRKPNNLKRFREIVHEHLVKYNIALSDNDLSDLVADCVDNSQEILDAFNNHKLGVNYYA